MDLSLVKRNRLERIWVMAKIEFKLRYYENKLGLLWALIKPLYLMGTYFIVFKLIMKNRIDNYAVFLFLGLLIWTFFQECTTGSIKILKTKKYLYEYTDMHKMDIYISVLLSNLIGLFFNLIVFLVVLLISGTINFSISWLFIPIIFLSLTFLAFGLSLILSNLFLVFKDVTQIWGIVITAGFFISPILYTADRFKETIPVMVYLNPISGMIINSRAIFLGLGNVDVKLMLFDLVYSLLVLALGVLYFKNRAKYASEYL